MSAICEYGVFCRFSILVFCIVFFSFLYSFMKMKAYSVCARAQTSIFMVFWLFRQKKTVKLLNKTERWPNKWWKVKTLEDKPRSGWPFFHKLFEQYYRKSCKYMCNNSTKQKGKKISTSYYRSKFRAQRYLDYRRRDNIQRSSPQNTGRPKTVTTLCLEECDFGHALGARTFYTSPLRKCQKTYRKTFWLLIF